MTPRVLNGLNSKCDSPSRNSATHASRSDVMLMRWKYTSLSPIRDIKYLGSQQIQPARISPHSFNPGRSKARHLSVLTVQGRSATRLNAMASM
jgi:hypothetical protein